MVKKSRNWLNLTTINFLLRGNTYIDYNNLQNSFQMFYITGKMRGEKIAAEVEPAVKKKQS